MKRRKLLSIAGISLASYSAAFTIAYQFASPAANLEYWCYTPEGWPEWSEKVAYVIFYPAYLVERSAVGPRHNYDREKIPPEALNEP